MSETGDTASVLEVHDRSELDRELDSLAELDALAGRIAHEINNPLAGIQHSFMLVRAAIPVTHPRYPYVGAIEREVERLTAVTRRLIEHYRPEHDGAIGLPIAIIVRDAVRAAIETTHSTGDRIAVELECRTAWPFPAGILGHPLRSLLESSLTASAPSRIALHVGCDNAELTIEACYDGGSVSSELLARARRRIGAMNGRVELADEATERAGWRVVVPRVFDPDEPAGAP